MTYTVGIPLDGQSLGNSKPQVRANFSVLFNYTAVNHVALNAMGAGKHAFVEMPNQPIGATPIPTTVADECAIYSKSLGTTPFANMVWQQESGGADPLRNQGAIVQMTGIVPNGIASGWTFLPGGMLMVWANPNTTGASTTITFPTPFKAATQPFFVQLTLNEIVSTFITLGATDRTATTFKVRQFGGANVSFFYVAVGLSP